MSGKYKEAKAVERPEKPSGDFVSWSEAEACWLVYKQDKSTFFPTFRLVKKVGAQKKLTPEEEAEKEAKEELQRAHDEARFGD